MNETGDVGRASQSRPVDRVKIQRFDDAKDVPRTTTGERDDALLACYLRNSGLALAVDPSSS